MRHFLSISDFTSNELRQFLHKAKELKTEFKEKGCNEHWLKGKILGMIFQKPSLRTRVSFEVAMLQLGGNALCLSPNDIGLGGRESVPDIARVMSSYVDIIVARVFSHDHILQFATHSRVPVINGLSDYNHPCQALTDIFTIWEYFGTIEGLKVAYVGDGNNVAASLILSVVKLGSDFTIATPPGYELPLEILAEARTLSEKTKVNITVTTDPIEAVADADIIYTDVWVSMGQENESEERLKKFPPYQINSGLMATAKNNAVIMHCLPAHRGEEITDEVADGKQSLLFQQAENRLHTQKGILALLLQ